MFIFKNPEELLWQSYFLKFGHNDEFRKAEPNAATADDDADDSEAVEEDSPSIHPFEAKTTKERNT